MSNIVDLPWPECLGTFDEESCRYFLHEVGSRTVPKFPFSLGMEEVYGLILGRYGREGVSDATSLLQELLEDEQNATGLGDDGDVWRSWRHGWRHRNDDALNPFIPHVSTFVFPPPTKPYIRMLKAANFALDWEGGFENNPSVEDKSPESSDCRFAVPNVDNSVLERQASSSHESPYPSVKSTGQLCRTSKRAPGTSIEPNLLTPSTVRENTLAGPEQLNISEGDLETLGIKNRAAKSMDVRTQLLRHSSSIPARFSDPSLSYRDPARTRRATPVALVQQQTHCSPSHNRNAVNADDKPDPGKIVGGPGQSVRSISPAVVQETTSYTAREAQPILLSEHDQRAVNREARLIDGTIFTPRATRSKTINRPQVDAVPESAIDTKRLSLRLSWSPKHRDSLRSNIRNEIRLLFRREKEHETKFEDKKHSSISTQHREPAVCHPSSMSAHNKHQIPLLAATNVARSPSSFGLDGTADTPNTLDSLINLNKPLPLSPVDIVRSMSTRSQLSTSRYSGTVSHPQSATSTESSLSKTSGKKEFKELTSNLLQQDMLPSHELPSIYEAETEYKRIPEPQKIAVEPTTPKFYTNMSETNPFIDTTRPNSPSRLLPPVNFSTPRHRQEGKPSEPEHSNYETVEGPLVPPKPGFKDGSALVQNMSMDDTRERGRSFEIPHATTPSRKEELPPKTPTKRSRSPIKRLLGLTKSNSASKSDVPETPHHPTSQEGSVKKESLKKWSNRLRYGFLTPDQEQLRQEELIEQHENESSSTTPQKSTFPVSLEPPLQAKIQSEVELILSVSANRYLMHEAKAGRISAESVAKTKDLWEKMNRPQVVEFHYDSITQHNLVMANLDRVKLHGDAAADAVAINSTMRGWKILAKEMSVRTFCSPDSVIRKHLHDAHRVLELLGAPLVTFLAYEDMQLKTLSTISQRQKERMDRRTGSQSRDPSGSSGILQMHRRNFSEGSQHYDYLGYPATALQMDKIRISPSPTPFSKPKVRKPTGGAGAIMSLPTNFERSRDAYNSTRPIRYEQKKPTRE